MDSVIDILHMIGPKNYDLIYYDDSHIYKSMIKRKLEREPRDLIQLNVCSFNSEIDTMLLEEGTFRNGKLKLMIVYRYDEELHLYSNNHDLLVLFPEKYDECIDSSVEVPYLDFNNRNPLSDYNQFFLDWLTLRTQNDRYYQNYQNMTLRELCTRLFLPMSQYETNLDKQYYNLSHPSILSHKHLIDSIVPFLYKSIKPNVKNYLGLDIELVLLPAFKIAQSVEPPDDMDKLTLYLSFLRHITNNLVGIYNKNPNYFYPRFQFDNKVKLSMLKDMFYSLVSNQPTPAYILTPFFSELNWPRCIVPICVLIYQILDLSITVKNQYNERFIIKTIFNKFNPSNPQFGIGINYLGISLSRSKFIQFDYILNYQFNRNCPNNYNPDEIKTRFMDLSLFKQYHRQGWPTISMIGHSYIHYRSDSYNRALVYPLWYYGPCNHDTRHTPTRTNEYDYLFFVSMYTSRIKDIFRGRINTTTDYFSFTLSNQLTEYVMDWSNFDDGQYSDFAEISDYEFPYYPEADRTIVSFSQSDEMKLELSVEFILKNFLEYDLDVCFSRNEKILSDMINWINTDDHESYKVHTLLNFKSHTWTNLRKMEPQGIVTYLIKIFIMGVDLLYIALGYHEMKFRWESRLYPLIYEHVNEHTFLSFNFFSFDYYDSTMVEDVVYLIYYIKTRKPKSDHLLNKVMINEWFDLDRQSKLKLILKPHVWTSLLNREFFIFVFLNHLIFNLDWFYLDELYNFLYHNKIYTDHLYHDNISYTCLQEIHTAELDLILMYLISWKHKLPISNKEIKTLFDSGTHTVEFDLPLID